MSKLHYEPFILRFSAEAIDLPDGSRFPAAAEVAVRFPVLHGEPELPSLKLRLEVRAGLPVVSDLVVRSPDFSEVAGTWLHSLPFNDIFGDAIRTAASNLVFREAFESGGPIIDWESGRMRQDVADGLDGAATLGRTTRRRLVTPALLEQVAAVYRGAVEEGKPPTKAVAEAVPCSHRTATRLVARARDAGLLDPYTRGGNQ